MSPLWPARKRVAPPPEPLDLLAESEWRVMAAEDDYARGVTRRAAAGFPAAGVLDHIDPPPLDPRVFGPEGVIQGAPGNGPGHFCDPCGVGWGLGSRDCWNCGKTA